jgi:GxxExxY protein
MDELLYQKEVFKIPGLGMQVRRELGKGYDGVIFTRTGPRGLSATSMPWPMPAKRHTQSPAKPSSCRRRLSLTLHCWTRFLLKRRPPDKWTECQMKQVLNYLPASKLQLGLLVNFREDSLSWKPVVPSKGAAQRPPGWRK